MSSAPASALTGDELLHLMQQNFLKQNIKTMHYVETSVVFMKVRENSPYNDTIPFNKRNVTRHKLNYYYKAPNRHKYKLLTKPIGASEIREPDKAGIEMDEEWENRIRENYSVALVADQECRGRACYVLNLVPLSDNRYIAPMTWYIDKQRLLVLKFISLSESQMAGKLSTRGDLYYRRIKGRWLLSSARWVQTPSAIPHKYEFKVYFGGHKINEEIRDSIFSEGKKE